MRKIAAVVVTYNRKKELKKNIEMLLSQSKQFDRIYIIDNNSSDGTEELIKCIASNIISYIKLPSNIGGAGGFSEGTKIAFNDCCDYVVLMDDDGRPYNTDTIRKLYEFAEGSCERKLMLNSLVFQDENTLSFFLDKKISSVKDAITNSHDGLIMHKINPFNGTLLSKELISSIGFPNASFFIKGDETDYTNRARKAKAFIATLTDSFYYHPAMKHNYLKFLFLKIENDLEMPWKEYYRARNYAFMYGKKYKMICLKRRIKSFLLHDKAYKKRNEYIRKGFKDGIMKNMGKTVNPGE